MRVVQDGLDQVLQLELEVVGPLLDIVILGVILDGVVNDGGLLIQHSSSTFLVQEFSYTGTSRGTWSVASRLYCLNGLFYNSIMFFNIMYNLRM